MIVGYALRPRLGRPKNERPKIFHAVVMDWTRKKINYAEAARRCKLPVSTFYAKAIPLRKKYLKALED